MVLPNFWMLDFRMQAQVPKQRETNIVNHSELELKKATLKAFRIIDLGIIIKACSSKSRNLNNFVYKFYKRVVT